jgi:hypothetical protein
MLLDDGQRTVARFREDPKMMPWAKRRATRLSGGILGATAAVLTLALTPALAHAEEPPGASTLVPAGCPSLEGCYGYGDMQAFYDEAIRMVGDFSASSYSAMPLPNGFYYIPADTQMQAGSQCGVADDNAFFLCESDDSIYVGQEKLWDFYNVDGDAAAAFGIAHEWGHHVQLVAGVRDRATTQERYIAAENQADCIGGAFLGHLNRQGVLEPDDYDDMNSILVKIASSESDPGRDHGTVEERAAATQHGLDYGLAACSQYFPEVPLVT